MKKLLVLVLLVPFICSLSQDINQLSWYKMLAGTIDRFGVMMHLHKAGHQYYGYYYYDSKQQPIYFIGEDTTQKGRIKLMSFGSSKGMEEFNFSLSNGRTNGSWRKDENSKALTFTANETTGRVSFDFVYSKGTVKLRPNLKGSPEATYEAASVWPKGSTSTDALLKAVIGSSFEKKYEGNEIGALFIRKKKEYFASYLQQNKNLKEAEIKEALPVYTSSISNRLMVAYQSSKLITLAFSDYTYTGGAHGNHGTTYACINLIHGKKLKLEVVISEAGRKAVGGLLEKSFRETHNLNPTDSLQKAGLFESMIKPTDNFYVTTKGIYFHYNPYEIGPYVMGEISIFILFKDLENYLQPGFRSLIEEW